jgi:hypothetical protein
MATEMRYFMKYRRKSQNGVRNKIIRGSLKLKTSENNLTNNRMRWYGHILRMSEGRTPKKVLNVKVKGKCTRGRLRSILEGRMTMGRNGRQRWMERLCCHMIRLKWKRLRRKEKNRFGVKK